jgi:ADP-heptose:LPS heptosyltransferase
VSTPVANRTPGEPAVDPTAVGAVLLVRPRFIGDVCLTLPTLDAVRAACPHARVAYLVEEESASLLEGDPRVDELLVAPRRGDLATWRRVVGVLRRFRPDVALDLFCNPRTALWTRLSGARVRVGYRGKGWRSALYTHLVWPRTLSAVDFHLASVARLGWAAPSAVPRLHISSARRLEAAAALREAGVPDGARLVGLHPGARWPTRRWDPRRFAALGRRFLETHPDGFVLVSGGPGEAPLVESVLAELPRGRAGPLLGWAIARFVAAQSLCAAFVCGDTGPLHTAVAAGVPTLGILSRNRPATFFPYPESLGHRALYARVECSPCHRDVCADLRCLHRLTVDAGWALLSGMLRRSTEG